VIHLPSALGSPYLRSSSPPSPSLARESRCKVKREGRRWQSRDRTVHPDRLYAACLASREIFRQPREDEALRIAVLSSPRRYVHTRVCACCTSICRTDDKGVFFRGEKIMRVRVHRCREEATQMLRRLIVRAAWPDARYGSRSARALSRRLAELRKAGETDRCHALEASAFVHEPCASPARARRSLSRGAVVAVSAPLPAPEIPPR